MSTLPRNPRYFPKMKVRGARRKRLAAFQRATGAFDRLVVAADQTAESMARLVELLKEEEK